MSKPTRHLSGEAKYIAFADLLHGAGSLLLTAAAAPEGSAYCRWSSVIFSAFAVEAALNHIGQNALPNWDKPRMSVWKKLESLEKYFGFKADRTVPPFNAIEELFRARDLPAHGKTTTETIEGEFDEHWDALDPEWRRRFSAPAYAQGVYDDTRAMIRSLLDNCGLQDTTLEMTGEAFLIDGGPAPHPPTPP